MAPAPEPTPAPQMTQVPEVGSPEFNMLLSSILASYSAGIYSQPADLYDDMLSSILASYTAGIPSAAIPTYLYPYLTATNPLLVIPTLTTREGAPKSVITITGTGTESKSSATEGAENNSRHQGGGMSQGAKIAIGVAVPVGVILIIIAAVLCCCPPKRFKRGKKTPPGTVVHQTPSGVGQINPQEYIPGQPYQLQNPPAPSAPPMYTAKPELPLTGVVELEQEYHFARPGVVEMGSGVPEEHPGRRR
ncbi:hypothetical protein GQ43DRAFT_468482 [Delitschia confertaspora ATCC 74209]|uniref:Uncharacterized protein n=1 Tax=Delitschia confertaspora ATCC 74209 TaxID=1513339 RepID=A0A9P4JU05_9PLEO|nr:hypothetical protein GQ43DRAFT_468482 [Delitschia confertaspora ATCC 74209]